MMEDQLGQQRLANYRKALQNLTEAVELSRHRSLSNLEQLGLIQVFEFTHELAWNCLKDYLQCHGEQNLMGSRDATRRAYAVGLISDGDQWMDMIANRSCTLHTYNKATAEQITKAVTDHYHSQFLKLSEQLTRLQDKEDGYSGTE